MERGSAPVHVAEGSLRERMGGLHWNEYESENEYERAQVRVRVLVPVESHRSAIQALRGPLEELGFIASRTSIHTSINTST